MTPLDHCIAIGDFIVGTLYVLLDGAIPGLVFSWLYNLLLGKGDLSKE
jgi:hypothetical protein